VSTVRTGKEEFFMTPRRSITEKRWIRGFTVAFLAITAAILLIAQSEAMAAAERLVIDVKDGDQVKKVEIWHDSDLTNVVVIIDGQVLKPSDRKPFPIELGPHTKRIVGIYPGPVIVFDGSPNCYLINNKWYSYPPGSVCP
jgi:hypothetical protein